VRTLKPFPGKLTTAYLFSSRPVALIKFPNDFGKNGARTWVDYRAIDVRRWKRDGLLEPGQFFGWQWSRRGNKVASIQVQTEESKIVLSYSHKKNGSEWQAVTYPVFLTWTDCHLGGQRPWFLCPAQNCYRRAAILYGGAVFACRHCHQLNYQSQRESYFDRTVRKTDKIRDRLGWERGILNDVTNKKPKGMHWATYDKLTIQHYAYMGIALNEMNAALAVLHSGLRKSCEKLF